MSSTPPPFDPNDPQDVAAEAVRQAMLDALIAIVCADALQALTPRQRLNAIVAGGMVGLVGATFVLTEKAGHPDMVKAMADYLPHAALQAESIMGSDVHVH